MSKTAIDNTRDQTNNAVLDIETEAGKKATFVCQFNPDELSISTQGHFSTQERNGEDSPIIQYLGGTSSTVSLDLFFDTSSSYEIDENMDRPVRKKAGDVTKYTNVLMNLVSIEGKLHRPPTVTFKWGSLILTGYVNDVKVTYTMFEMGGKPVRAKAGLTLIAPNVTMIDTKKVSPPESPDRTKCVVMTEDSSLWNIAEQEYGDSAYWREIAKANGIMNPLNVPVGTYLKVPALQL